MSNKLVLLLQGIKENSEDNWDEVQTNLTKMAQSRYGINGNDLCEIVQTTLIKTWENLHKFDFTKPGGVYNYVRRIISTVGGRYLIDRTRFGMPWKITTNRVDLMYACDSDHKNYNRIHDVTLYLFTWDQLLDIASAGTKHPARTRKVLDLWAYGAEKSAIAGMIGLKTNRSGSRRLVSNSILEAKNAKRSPEQLDFLELACYTWSEGY